MRLHRLEITGVGPFRERQVIDFEPMMDAGLFLIDGPTGAGKTTIIDAITFALFGTTSGFESDTDRLRSDYCSLDDPTEVMLDFSVRGRRHRIVRSPEYLRAARRRNESGTTTQAARQNLIEFGQDGEPDVTLTSAADIGVHVHELLGMGSQQFRQLVVLPQGEFAHLLRMSPKDRLDALQNLLGSDFFTKVQTALVEAAESARNVQRVAAERTDAAVRSFVTRATETDLPLDSPLQSLVESTESARQGALTQVLSTLQSAVAEIAEQDAAAQNTLIQARRARDVSKRAADAVQALIDARATLADRLEALDAPKADEVTLQEESRVIMERIGALRPLTDWEAKAADRERDRRELAKASSSCAERVEQLTERRRALPVEISGANAEVTDAKTLIADQSALEQRIALLDEHIRGAERLVALRQQTADLESVLDETIANRESAATALTHAEQALDDLHARQLADRAAQLAAELTAGQPCPVCGATEHPVPAAGDADHIGDAQMRRSRTAVADAKRALERATNTQQDADGRLREHRAALQMHVDRWGAINVAEAKIEIDEARRRLDQATQVAQRLPDLESAVEQLLERERRIDEDLRQAERDHAQAVASLRAFDQRIAEREAEVRMTVGNDDCASQAMADAEQRLEILRQAIGAWQGVTLAQAAVGSDVDDPARVLQQAAADEHACAAAEEAAERIRTRFVTMSNAQRALADLAEEIMEASEVSAGIHERLRQTIELADLVTARTPTNRRKLTLASFAVQLRFANVLESASIHLERMSAGQYSFILHDAAPGRGLAGLGIQIRDSWTGQDRDPKTLSGGETFYASLALALGLADVVQAETGGAQLETLFVDEGFGTLDPDTLQLVLDQLDLLRTGGRVVGVISHVVEMKERIADRIQVTPREDHTSTVNQVPEPAASI